MEIKDYKIGDVIKYINLVYSESLLSGDLTVIGFNGENIILATNKEGTKFGFSSNEIKLVRRLEDEEKTLLTEPVRTGRGDREFKVGDKVRVIQSGDWLGWYKIQRIWVQGSARKTKYMIDRPDYSSGWFTSDQLTEKPEDYVILYDDKIIGIRSSLESAIKCAELNEEDNEKVKGIRRSEKYTIAKIEKEINVKYETIHKRIME